MINRENNSGTERLMERERERERKGERERKKGRERKRERKIERETCSNRDVERQIGRGRQRVSKGQSAVHTALIQSCRKSICTLCSSLNYFDLIWFDLPRLSCPSLPFLSFPFLSFPFLSFPFMLIAIHDIRNAVKEEKKIFHLIQEALDISTHSVEHKV